MTLSYVKIWIAILWSLISCQLFGQVFNGRVRDKTDKAPLPYANIGVKGKSIGGITDKDGLFSINIAKAVQSDQIVVSYLGYESQIFLVKEIEAGKIYEVKLNQKSYQLKEVVIHDRREKIILGNNRQGYRFTGWGHNESEVGKSRGLILDPKEFPVKAVYFVMHVNDNTFDSVRFRLNILAPGDNGENPIPILNENIFFVTTMKNKWIRIDVDKFDIVISTRIVVAVEWVDAWGKKKNAGEESHQLTVSMCNTDGYFYTRETPEEPITLQFSDYTPSMYFECFGLNE